MIGNKIIRSFFRKYRQQQAVSVGRADTLESLISNFYGYVLFFTFAILLLQNFMDVTAIIASAGWPVWQLPLVRKVLLVTL